MSTPNLDSSGANFLNRIKGTPAQAKSLQQTQPRKTKGENGRSITILNDSKTNSSWKPSGGNRASKKAAQTLGKHRTSSKEQVWKKGVPKKQENKGFLSKVSKAFRKGITIGGSVERRVKALEKEIQRGESRLKELDTKSKGSKKKIDQIEKRLESRKNVNIAKKENEKFKNMKSMGDDLYGVMKKEERRRKNL